MNHCTDCKLFPCMISMPCDLAAWDLCDRFVEGRETRIAGIRYMGKVPLCDVCRIPQPDFTPEYCCNGIECGCMGMAIEPCLCPVCEKQLFGGTVE